MTRLSLLALAAALGLSGTAWAAPPSDTIRVQLNGDLRSTDPGTKRDDNTDAVILHVVEGLVAYREDATVGPMLADSVAVSDDGKTYTFTLRDGVKFQNGAPMTSAEVVWSWKRWLDPKTEWRCLPEFDGRGRMKIESVEALDPKTVVFKLNTPSALFLTTMARTDCAEGAVIHPDSVGPDGKWIAPIGTGPYRLEKWEPGQYVILKRFADYASRGGERDGYTGGKQALAETVRFTIIGDPAAAKTALLAGDIDLVPDVSVADKAEIDGQKGVRTELTQTLSMSAILIQTRDPLLKDVRLRKALALAIDNTQIAQAVTQGTSPPNPSVIPAASPYYTDVERQGYGADVEQAKALLAEAGYTGQPIKMLVNRKYQSVYDTAILAQALAQQAGINIELEVLDWGAQLDRYTSGQYQTMSFSYSARMDPALSYEMVSGPKDTQPRKVWENPEALKLIQDAMVTSDPKQRQAIFDQLHKLQIADVPLIVTYNGAEIAALSDRLEGYKPWVASKPRLWNVAIKN
ncbi:ABC transporter substrate-binding protein [Inquilinus sp. NPDC058860]|uniref:ABC transporter substrate-binding protein n=1 Tax=Inquilinus sp. NPDC058860 TaxID=3346652 RepID=UPI003692322F